MGQPAMQESGDVAPTLCYGDNLNRWANGAIDDQVRATGKNNTGEAVRSSRLWPIPGARPRASSVRNAIAGDLGSVTFLVFLQIWRG